MKNKSLLALVVSNSGTLQDGLLALMTTIPQVSTVLVAEDIKATIRMVENHQPALVLLDMALHKNQVVVQKIKTQWPNIHVVLLVENVSQQKKGEASGADSVLIKGFPVQKLIAIVEGLIEQQESTSKVDKN